MAAHCTEGEAGKGLKDEKREREKKDLPRWREVAHLINQEYTCKVIQFNPTLNEDAHTHTHTYTHTHQRDKRDSQSKGKQRAGNDAQEDGPRNGERLQTAKTSTRG